MSGKGPDDKARALLSKDALPKIEIPKSRDLRRREFKLPDELDTPIPGRVRPPETDAAVEEVPASATAVGSEAGETEVEAPTASDRSDRRRRPRNSTGRFKERTLSWFETGEEMETDDDGELPAATEAAASGGFATAALVGAAALLAAVVLALWLV